MKAALVRLVPLVVLAALIPGAAALAGCVAGLEEGAGRAAEPPAPLPEFPTTPSVPGMVWVGGAWHWNGANHVWVPGRWESPPPLPVAPSRPSP